MRTLIVAKTRRGHGFCLGAISETGQSLRLLFPDSTTGKWTSVDYDVGEIWDVETTPTPNPLPPHIEDCLVVGAKRLGRSERLLQTILRRMPPATGGLDSLFTGMLRSTPAGALYIPEGTRQPPLSAHFWRPDRPLKLATSGKRIRYLYPAPDGEKTFAFVGFQEPLPEIPAGALLRVSLAPWWRPRECPDEELRCYAQICGWIPAEPVESQTASTPAPVPETPPSGAPDATSPLMAQALAHLKQTFGFSRFLPTQEAVVDRILHRKDTLVVMPTGGGKSLCYQLPALVFPGLTVVISPLVALMQDQVRQLEDLEVPAACLNHMVESDVYGQIMHKVRIGSIKLLYVAPETLLRPEILHLLSHCEVSCVAIDEAHCISAWGHDFRPDYRQIQSLKLRFPDSLWIALTATATTRVRKDIRDLFNIPPEGEFVASFNRTNLFLAVEHRDDCIPQILEFLEPRRGECGIIYCGMRKQADEIAADLTRHGWPAIPYHAGLDREVRQANQERFQQEDAPLMVATVAFGMGINKPNVRFVIHAHLPKDIESYYQEIGRAGRDGLPAQCLLLHNRSDAMLHRHFIQSGAESERAGRESRLQSILRYAESRACRRVPLLGYFDESSTPPCGLCDQCVPPEPSGTGTGADVTANAIRFLTAVRLTGQVFGAAHIIAILRGSRSARITQLGHDALPVFDTGRSVSEQTWKTLSREFIQLGLLNQGLEYGGLSLTEAGEGVLAGGTKVASRAPTRSAKRAPRQTSTSTSGKPHDPRLFDILRQLRRQIASEAGIPPFIVFSDRTLIEMASIQPRTEADLLSINGVGKAKYEKYGRAFLEAVCSHCGAPPPAKSRRKPAPVEDAKKKTPRAELAAALFNDGESIEQIAVKLGIKTQTLVDHLHRHVQEGGHIDKAHMLRESLLPEPLRDQVLAEFERLGTDRLQPVHDALGGMVPHSELQILRIYVLCEQESAAS